MPLESEKWGWKHVSIVGGFDRGSGTKKWKCNHCHHLYNGSFSRVKAHLLGFNGLGVKPCPAIDCSSREAFRILEEDRLTRKLMKKKISSKTTTKKSLNPSLGTNRDQLEGNFSTSIMRNLASKNYVDDVVARFFYMGGLNVDVVNSSYYREMVRALGACDRSRYEPPSLERLSGCLLNKEKARLEKILALARESWPHTGCTILCVNRLDGSLGCFCVNFFVASPRGVFFLKEVDIIEGDGPDNLFIDELSNAIIEVGPSNVVQVVTHLGGQASDAFESIILSKFPHIFWSHCTSHSILLLMEEIAQLDWISPVVSRAKEISSSCKNTDILNQSSNPVSQKFAPSYYLVKQIFETNEGWFNDFRDRAKLMLEMYEPFVRLLTTFDHVDRSSMGDVYNWRISSLEALRNKGFNEISLNQLELLIESRWDKLFSPLHGVAYILHPRYFGKEQSKDKSLTRAWNATLERYDNDIEGRRVLREELGSFWRAEGSFGEGDAIECRDKMGPISWWESFGYETPRLQSLAIKILCQVSSSSIVCRESWQCESMPCREAVRRFGLGVERGKDFVFVRNNLRLQSLRSEKVGCQFGAGNDRLC